MLACLLVAFWLLCGASLRSRFAIFDRIYIPPSVIAGFVGLIAFQAMAGIGRVVSAPVMSTSVVSTSALSTSLAGAMESLRNWPPILIAIVFAGMLLPRATVPWRQSIRAAGREVLMVWIIVLGQTAIGLLVTWLIIRPFYEVPASFGMLIETGFAGGHGTANAMGQVFRSPQIDFSEGLDLGLMMATLGLIYGTVSGILWINLAIRWGWVPGNERRQTADQPTADAGNVDAVGVAAQSPVVDVRSITSHDDARRSAFARGLDPLLVQAIWLAMALGIGWTLQSSVSYATRTADKAQFRFSQTQNVQDGDTANAPIQPTLSYEAVLGGFPLFIYTLIGGWIVRKLLKLIRCGYLIDEAGVSRWTSIAMDLLVVAAIATLNLAAVVELIVPFSILAISGMIWTAVCLMVISRHVLPETHWFQLGLINYGMSTGVTATGFVLLRIIDPELKTEAAKEYAIAAPFSAPFIGGGLLTISLPLIVLERVPMSVTAVLLTLLVCILVTIGWRLPGRH